MKKGLILEGGAMRGIFTAGVLDVMMENNIEFDGAVGVSAGACFGCNIKSRQIGRTIRYNKKYARDKRYASLWSLAKTGDLYGVDFCYGEIPQKLDPFDTATFRENPMEFYVVATDVKKGNAVYHKCYDGLGKDLLWIRASASMPIVSRIVDIDGRLLLDGGMTDAIPVKFFEHKGYERNVVVLTRPEEYRKKANQIMPVIRKALKDYPEAIHAMEVRHLRYNQTLAYIREKEKNGELFVIRPPKALEIGKIEKNPAKMQAVYEVGRKTTLDQLAQLRTFLQQ